MSTISHPRAINHVGVGVADLDAAIEWYTTIMGFSVVKQGFFVTSEQPGFRMCYCEDPFGNILEVYSHNYEMLYGGI
jgi:catechol-2,3-dioxygenase